MENIAKDLKISAQIVRDIITELEKVGVDPRDVGQVKLRTGPINFEDLKVDEWVEGTVTNVVDFGCFVDIGIGHDGMLHKSQIINNNNHNNIYGLISVGDSVKVRIDNIKSLNRISLSLKPASKGKSVGSRDERKKIIPERSQSNQPRTRGRKEDNEQKHRQKGKSEKIKPQTNRKRKRGDEIEVTNPKKVKK